MTPSSQSPQDTSDARIASEFRELYRRPGTRYLGLGALMGGISALGFYGIDAVGGALPWYGGAQSLRLLFAALCFATAALTRLCAELATRM